MTYLHVLVKAQYVHHGQTVLHGQVSALLGGHIPVLHLRVVLPVHLGCLQSDTSDCTVLQSLCMFQGLLEAQLFTLAASWSWHNIAGSLH